MSFGSICAEGMAAKILELSLDAQAFRPLLWLRRMRRPGVPRFVGLQFIWIPWASGALRLIEQGGHDMDLFVVWTSIEHSQRLAVQSAGLEMF